jgi:hypothetical protein
MKNKIIILFLFSLIIPIHSSFAFGEYNLGGSLNPVTIQIQQNANEQRRQENLLLQSQLKTQYGYSIYSSCKSSVCGSYDVGDPSSEASCLIMLEAWLGRGICQAQRQQVIDNIQCNTGYVKLNGECVSFDQSCNAQFPNTIFLEYDTNGKRVCDCKTGYSWNSNNTACVITTKNTIDLKNVTMFTIPEGFVFPLNDVTNNKESAKTAPVPKVTTPVVKKVEEVKEVTPSVNNLDIVNQDKVITPTEEVKPKSLWTKIKSWFGL